MRIAYISTFQTITSCKYRATQYANVPWKKASENPHATDGLSSSLTFHVCNLRVVTYVIDIAAFCFVSCYRYDKTSALYIHMHHIIAVSSCVMCLVELFRYKIVTYIYACVYNCWYISKCWSYFHRMYFFGHEWYEYLFCSLAWKLL